MALLGLVRFALPGLAAHLVAADDVAHRVPLLQGLVQLPPQRLAGLLGLPPDDPRLPQSFVLAREAGMDLSVSAAVIRGAHPNTAILRVENREGRVLEVNASSLGGGRVRVNAIDGMEATFTGDYPTLIIRNEDKPGQVAEVAGLLSEHGVNIAAMQLYRDRRGGLAVMVIESDQPIPEGMADYLRTLPGIVRCTYLNMGEAD